VDEISFSPGSNSVNKVSYEVESDRILTLRAFSERKIARVIDLI